MKKRDLVLDFTSLLDVIMIILFVVVSSMGQNALDVQAESEKKVSELQEVVNQLEDNNDELKSENEYYKKKADETNVDDADVMKVLLKKTIQITLDCKTFTDEDKTDSDRVEITVYKGRDGEDRNNVGTISFTHNLNLSADDRQKKHDEHMNSMFNKLKEVIESEKDIELVILTIQYKYNDEIVSQADLNNINNAIMRIEDELDISCFVDSIKQ